MERRDGQGNVWFQCESCQMGIQGTIVEAENTHYHLECLDAMVDRLWDYLAKWD